MEVMYPDRKGRKGGESKDFIWEFWPLYCKKCDIMLVLSAAFRYIVVVHQHVLSTTLPAAYHFSPEGPQMHMGPQRDYRWQCIRRIGRN